MWVQKKDENKKLQEIIKSNQITRELYRNFVEKRDIENLTSQLIRIHQEDVAFLISSLFTHKLLNDKEMSAQGAQVVKRMDAAVMAIVPMEAETPALPCRGR